MCSAVPDSHGGGQRYGRQRPAWRTARERFSGQERTDTTEKRGNTIHRLVEAGLGRGEVGRHGGVSIGHRKPGEAAALAVGAAEPGLRASRPDGGLDTSPRAAVRPAVASAVAPETESVPVPETSAGPEGLPQPDTLPKAVAEPSWGRVLATTVSLWASRRLPSVGIGWRHDAGWSTRTQFRRSARQLRRPRVGGLRVPILALVLALVLVLAAAAVAVLRFTAIPSAAARSPVADRPHLGNTGGRGAVRSDASLRVAAAARAQAAAWIADQVSSNETIACDPLMRDALRAHGVAPSRLLPLRPDTADPSGADLIVASSSSRSGVRLTGADPPVLIASFGSGRSLIDVSVTSPAGTAAYNSALQADLAARRSAGAQLLRSRRVEVSAQQAEQLEAGDVDTRLMVTLVTLGSLQPWRVIAFADASPGERVPYADAPFRQVTVASAGSGDGAVGLAAALALVRAQLAPYRPAEVAVIDPTASQVELRIEFAAPSPLGLLTGGAPG